ncbi:family 16 glycosylhydrolase [Rubellicoccus peritrichatus]|uniref:Family 16 glycosylhydrolase n=1 Tax=Rubellicoccus peritrichatus TaxID=3080537 RepID=A0AAQ3QVN6_9BACT|nr:family 16 glycosylhydrolase [Puniceicoccus sp. CR14]WOO41808.1 family 16 glycosylhydrolase [Puniceicoccus sp. CR14]
MRVSLFVASLAFLIIGSLWSIGAEANTPLPKDIQLIGSATEQDSSIYVEGIGGLFIKEPFGHFQATLEVEQYPIGADKNPAFEMVIPHAIRTNKVRFVSHDGVVHVTEIRLFESGLPEYPDIMNPEKSSVAPPNLAANATVTASSNFDGREPTRAVDGKISFDSRWFSSGQVPHYLTIELDKEKTIGCIQMVSGYFKGDFWASTAKEFEFQYWDDGDWKTIPGVKRGGSAGGLSVGILDSTGSIFSIDHDNEGPTWKTSIKRGDFEETDSFTSKINIVEGERNVIETLAFGDTVYFYLNSHAITHLSGDFQGADAIGIASNSPDSILKITDVQTEEIDEATCTLLADAEIFIDGQKLDFSFDPLRSHQQIQLKESGLKEISISLRPGVPDQRILINGKTQTKARIRPDRKHAVTFEVTTIAPDGKTSRSYRFDVLPVPPYDDYELVFSDEFDGDELDLQEWDYRTGKRWESLSLPESISLQDGNLRIKLSVEDGVQKVGGIISKQEFGYGYYETRAKLWKHEGWHSAFWQMGTARNNLINEIDGFESVSPDSFSTNLQYYMPRMILGAQEHKASVAEKFHTIAWEWTPTHMRFFLEGELIREEAYPPPHGLQNVWLSCVAHPNASLEDLPGEILFDYFRYYRKPYGDEIPEGAIVIDQSSPQYVETGTWEFSDNAISHLHKRGVRLSSTPGSTATWSTTLPNSGTYEVFAWNPYVFSDGVLMQYDFVVSHENGTSKASFNPMTSGQIWVSLGQYQFSSDENAKVTLSVQQPLPIRGDAVMFVPR